MFLIDKWLHILIMRDVITNKPFLEDSPISDYSQLGCDQ